MIIPSSTYRVQFSGAFSFEDLQQSLEYLRQLGVSTIYASPIFKSALGSTHGYDVLDPYTLDPELGSLELFRTLSKSLEDKKMNWLQDIVPNHMRFSSRNPWMHDILELGPTSEYYNYFDIDWKESGKVMAPFLGSPLETVLSRNELKLQQKDDGFVFTYFEHIFPASAGSYAAILNDSGSGKWLENFRTFSGNSMQWEDLKISFFREVQEDIQLVAGINTSLEQINIDPQKFRELLELQYFRLVPWQTTESEINYRRFFTINELICLNMQDSKVFENYHYFLKELTSQKLIQGLRIDHIDGLFNPTGYLRDLRTFISEDQFLVVEKIQEADESIPGDWPVQGSTGYDFMAQVNHLFTQTENEEAFSKAYAEIAPELPEYKDLVYQKKLLILNEKMGGELQNLYRQLTDEKLLGKDQDAERSEILEALASLLASFPVYRIYPEGFPLEGAEREVIETAFSEALRQTPALKTTLGLLKQIYLGENNNDPDKSLAFLQRSQQFTGPLAAKGVEDTVFYNYNRLLSHNEVGDSPARFGLKVEDFHQKMQNRQQQLPYSLNATATHDTKRGEDARMRLNVLSEIPGEWFEKFREWQELNASLKKDSGIPAPNQEYFIYQSLLAAFPFKKSEKKGFPDRLQEYLQKAFREAKEFTSWANPDESFESAITEFVTAILEHKTFLRSFEPFQERIAFLGVIKSLSQALIKITAPGIPDIYQGTELWDFSFVDPDNRRPVDFNVLKSYINEFKSFVDDKLNESLKQLRASYPDGRIKMYLLIRALNYRKVEKNLFENGEYLPLEISGNKAADFIAYARHYKEKWAIVVAPVMVSQTFQTPNLVPKKESLEEMLIHLPENAPRSWKNCFTSQKIIAEKSLSGRELFTDFPLVLLTNTD